MKLTDMQDYYGLIGLQYYLNSEFHAWPIRIKYSLLEICACDNYVRIHQTSDSNNQTKSRNVWLWYYFYTTVK